MSDVKSVDSIVEQAKQDFVETFEHIIIPKYPSAKSLLEWLQKTSFFADPASSKYHSSFMGGLCLHSVVVYDRLVDLVEHNAQDWGYKELFAQYSDADIAIAALCHDLCKIGNYVLSTKNVKVKLPNGTTQWVEEPFYMYNEDIFIYGHGEKSSYILMRLVPELPDHVLQAVRYHMGGIENAYHDANASKSYAQNPLALLLHLADMQATFLDERKLSKK